MGDEDDALEEGDKELQDIWEDVAGDDHVEVDEQESSGIELREIYEEDEVEYEESDDGYEGYF